MINDINEISKNLQEFFSINELQCVSDNSHSYYLKEIKVDNILNEVFKICSLNEYCFSIFRDKFAQIKVIIFDKYENDSIEFLFFTIDPNEILLDEQTKYTKRVNFLRKLKILPVIGPDGAGKTTLLTQVIKELNQKIFYKRFKKIVRRSIIYNIVQPINKYFLTKKLGRKPEKDQHDDIHYLLIIFAGLGYYPYLFFQSLFKKNIIILDRFFYDYLLKDISFMEKKTCLRKNWKFLLKFIPKSYWIIHLDANAEIILSRKEELSFDDIEKYRELNFMLYLNKPSVVYSYINTGLEIERCKNILLKTGRKSKVFND